MFTVNQEKKLLETFDKSGCCWHITERYSVIAGRPVKVWEEVEDATIGDTTRVKVTRRIHRLRGFHRFQPKLTCFHLLRNLRNLRMTTSFHSVQSPPQSNRRTASLCPVSPIQRTVVHCFRDMG